MTRTDKTEIDGLFSTLKEMSEMAAKTTNMVDNPAVRKYIQDAIKDAEDTQTFILATLKTNFRYLFVPSTSRSDFVDVELTMDSSPGRFFTINPPNTEKDNWFWFSFEMPQSNVEGGVSIHTDDRSKYKIFINPDKVTITRIGAGETIYSYEKRFMLYVNGSGQTNIIRDGKKVCVSFNDMFNEETRYTDMEWNDLKDRADMMKTYTQQLVRKFKEWVQERIQKVSEAINASDRAKAVNQGCPTYVPVEK